jgi:uncharacterized protein (TIGR03118 family)
MSRNEQFFLILLLFAAVMMAALPARAGHQNYVQTNLVSDGAVSAVTIDPDLKNPWGITFRPAAGMTAGSPFWISDNNAGVSTLYDGNGTPIAALPNVTIPAPGSHTGGTPTGTVFNIFAGSNAFIVPNTGNTPASFIFDTEDGTIVAWNAKVPDTDDPVESPPDVTPNDDAVIVVDNSAMGAVYKGLAIAKDSGNNPRLYATNFNSGEVEVYDTTFAPVSLSGSFTDPKLPAHYAPFGIQSVDGKLFVTYALQDAAKHDPVNKPAHGIVDIFDTDGNFIERFVSHGHLDSPWGVVMAPSTFGRFANDILIGNFGNGKINAYDPNNRKFKGVLTGSHGKPLVNDGLWALTFGGALNSSVEKLYFTAGLNSEADGLFGSIAPQ